MHIPHTKEFWRDLQCISNVRYTTTHLLIHAAVHDNIFVSPIRFPSYRCKCTLARLCRCAHEHAKSCTHKHLWPFQITDPYHAQTQTGIRQPARSVPQFQVIFHLKVSIPCSHVHVLVSYSSMHPWFLAPTMNFFHTFLFAMQAAVFCMWFRHVPSFRFCNRQELVSTTARSHPGSSHLAMYHATYRAPCTCLLHNTSRLTALRSTRVAESQGPTTHCRPINEVREFLVARVKLLHRRRSRCRPVQSTCVRGATKLFLPTIIGCADAQAHAHRRRAVACTSPVVHCAAIAY